MRQARQVRGRNRAAGFTLFEMVVVICSIAILYMVAEERINELPAAAERANFLAVLEQVKTGVTLEMLGLLADDQSGAVQEMAGGNPMSWLLEAPVNYLGEQDLVTDALRRRNAWYFETTSGQLVYLVGGNSIGDVQVIIATIPVYPGQIRFRIESLYDDGRGGVVYGSDLGPQAERLTWEGVQLVPVHEFSWESRAVLQIQQ